MIGPIDPLEKMDFVDHKPRVHHLNSRFIPIPKLVGYTSFTLICNKSILPGLRVIDSGVFKGFVVINPRWAGSHEGEFFSKKRLPKADTRLTPFGLTSTTEKQAQGAETRVLATLGRGAIAQNRYSSKMLDIDQ